jgi:hypothetical protein
MVDLHQRESFRSLIERRTLEAFAFTSADLGRIAREGVSSADPRWWMTVGWLIPSVMPAPAGIDSRAAQRFEQAGWIAAEGTGWRMTASFMRLLDGFVMPSRYAVVRAVDHRTAGEAVGGLPRRETPRSLDGRMEGRNALGVAVASAAEPDVPPPSSAGRRVFAGAVRRSPRSGGAGAGMLRRRGTIVAAQHRFCGHCGRLRHAAGDADRP